jgi:hypothetical protein
LKTRTVLLVAVFLFISILPGIAQDARIPADTNPDNWANLFYINVPIEKIYPHTLGFMVLYQKSNNELGRLYLPDSWFTASGGKGDLIKMDAGTTWPYLVIFYKDGKFSHVRLYVKRDKSHPSWGLFTPDANIADKFKVEDIKIEF